MNLDPLGKVYLTPKQVGAIRRIASTFLLLLHIVGPKGGAPGHALSE